MSAVTKLPEGPLKTDAHFPFYAVTGNSSSAISPLTLPRGTVGCFDHMASAIHTSLNGAPATGSRSNQVYSPLSPGVRGPFPTYLLPVAQRRSTSLPPKAGNSKAPPVASSNGERPTRALERVGGPSIADSSPVISPQYNSPESAIVRRLAQQNRQIREAWEAERKYLEANRERAEEVYKEERALMEEERAEWEAEKTRLLQEIDRLQRQVIALSGSSPRAATNGAFQSSTAGYLSSPPLRGGGSSTSPQSQTSAQPSRINTFSTANGGGFVLPSRDPPPHQHFPISSTSMKSPSGTAPGAPNNTVPDFLVPSIVSESASEPGRTRLVDVQDIDPALEGIPIKVSAITKPTFTDPPSASPPKENGSSVVSPTGLDPVKIKPGTKKETLQVLAANESARLTMHAGHTPSHSLSLLPTGIATASSSDDGSSTPTMQQEDGAAASEDAAANDASAHAAEPHPAFPGRNGQEVVDGHPEEIFEPSEDRRLKGPLMVRNMPANDEIFFQKLSDKLEEVSKDDKAALPAVLKDAQGDGAIAVDDAEPAIDEDSSKSDDEDEAAVDVPLRLRRPMNFGAPFGEIKCPNRLAAKQAN